MDAIGAERLCYFSATSERADKLCLNLSSNQWIHNYRNSDADFLKQCRRRRGPTNGPAFLRSAAVSVVLLAGRRWDNRPEANVTKLHYRRDGDAHDRESANQFAADDSYGGEQELFSLLIGLAQYGKAVVKSVEELR